MEYQQDQHTTHQNIIWVGDPVPQHINMADYTVTTPTNPMAPPVYPVLNKKPMQY